MEYQGGYGRYLTNEIGTASPERLVVLAYDGMLRFLREAEKAMESSDFETQNEKIQRVQSILSLLAASLRPDVFPDLCKSLSSLYDWFKLRLTKANIDADPAILAEVRNEMSGLRDAWSAAEMRCRSKAEDFPALQEVAG